MAKKLTDKEEAREASADDLKRCVAEVNRQKANAAEYNGLAGKAAQSSIERYGLDRVAFTLTCRLSKMEEPKREAAIRSMLRYFFDMGFFDQFSMFDNIADDLEKILEAIKTNDNSERTSEDGDVLDELSG